jgi:hypothetical protein
VRVLKEGSLKRNTHRCSAYPELAGNKSEFFCCITNILLSLLSCRWQQSFATELRQKVGKGDG